MGRRARLISLLAAVAATLALAAPPASAAASFGSIEGTVTDASTAEAIEGVEVCAYLEAAEFPSECVNTDSQGDYTITVEQGEYKVEFWPGQTGYLFQFYKGTTSWAGASLVEVTGGSVTPGIDAQLIKGGTITGTVTDAATHQGIAEVLVCAYQIGGSEWEFCAETKEDGSYALGGLPAGSYKVEFWATRLDYVPQFFDAKARWEEASAIPVTLGATAEEIDAALEKGAIISGTVTDAATGAGLGDIFVCAHTAADGKFAACALSEPGGSYSMLGLASGSYKIGFSEELEPGFPEDGYQTQYYRDRSTLAEADVLSVTAPDESFGVDGHLHGASRAPALTPPPVTLPITPELPRPKHHRCRRGFRPKRIHGKRRCVRVHRHRPHRHHHRLAATAAR